MKYLRTFESYNESMSTNIIYRNTDEEWLKELLKYGYIKDDFISFSRDEESGSMDDFGDVNIQFNEDKLDEQGLIIVGYDEEFFEQNPDICQHVTGFKSKEEFYENSDCDNDEEAIKNCELTWSEYIEDFMGEDELVVKDKLEYTDGLIEHVIFNDEGPESETIELLRKNNISYEINK